jgi:hypothetical protein
MWHKHVEVTFCGCAMWQELADVDHWLSATWHYGGAHLSGDLCQGGAHNGEVDQ